MLSICQIQQDMYILYLHGTISVDESKDERLQELPRRTLPSLFMKLYVVISNGFRSGQNRDPTGDRPTFVSSSVGSVWIWQYSIDSPITASVGPKKLSVDVSSRSWSDRVGLVQLEPNIREISIEYESQSGL